MNMLNKIAFILFLFFPVIILTSAFKLNNYPQIKHKDGLYIVKINLNKYNVKSYVSQKLDSLYDIVKATNPTVAINSGFFDTKNKKSASYVYNDGELVVSPEDNENLINNPKLKKHLQNIFNRGELRILYCNNQIKADVAFHNTPIPRTCMLISSAQAGPILLPNMDLEKEYFIEKNNNAIARDSINAYKKTARSAVALKKNDLYFIITDEKSPLTIFEFQKKLSKIKFQKALNLDGGGSVSLYVKTKKGEFFQSREKNNTFRKIKSALIVK